MEHKEKRNGKFIGKRDVEFSKEDLTIARYNLVKIKQMLGLDNIYKVDIKENKPFVEIPNDKNENVCVNYKIFLHTKDGTYKEETHDWSKPFISRKTYNTGSIFIGIFNEEGIKCEGSDEVETQFEVFVQFYGFYERKYRAKKWVSYDNKLHFGYAYSLTTLFDETIIPSIEEFINAYKPLIGAEK
jgi:hypothetical protein